MNDPKNIVEKVERILAENPKIRWFRVSKLNGMPAHYLFKIEAEPVYSSIWLCEDLRPLGIRFYIEDSFVLGNVRFIFPVVIL